MPCYIFPNTKAHGIQLAHRLALKNQTQTAFGDPARQFHVDKVADPHRAQANRAQRRKKIGDGQKIFVVTPTKYNHRHQHTEEAPMEGHAAFPDTKKIEGIRGQALNTVKEGIADATAQHRTHGTVKHQVRKLFRVPTGVQ